MSKSEGQTSQRQLALGDSIFKMADFTEINHQLGTNIRVVSTYCPTYTSNNKFQWSNQLNFEDVLERELKKASYSTVIMGLPSIPITDLVGSNVLDPNLCREVVRSNHDMLKIAVRAIEHYLTTKEVFFVERAPRHDKKKELSEFANEDMHRILQNSPYQDSIRIIRHNLTFPEGKARNEVYGTPNTHPRYDGYHLRADHDKAGRDRAMTKSLLHALRSAGL